MTDFYYYALFAGYATAVLGWVIVHRCYPALWPKVEPVTFRRPWVEIGWAFLAVLGIIALGQLYQAGIRLPGKDPWGVIPEAINQVLIFSPLFILLRLRRQSLTTVWMSTYRIVPRLAVGVGLALIAIFACVTVLKGSASWPKVVAHTYHPSNFAFAVQILLEDITIAALYIRFRAAIGTRWTICLVAILFAAGHIPALLAGGAGVNELVTLVLDAGLLIVILPAIQRSADIWWIWCVHFAMDMMQFYARP